MPKQEKKASLPKFYVPEFDMTVEAEDAVQAAEIAKTRAAGFHSKSEQHRVEAQAEAKKSKKTK